MTKEGLLMEYNQATFAAWELVLFLDTHPNNKEALAFHHYYTQMAKSLKKEYEQRYGPLTSSGSNDRQCWDWIQGPWPWQNEWEV